MLLDDFIDSHRKELIALARKKVSARRDVRRTEADISAGVPLCLDQLTAVLRAQRPNSGATQGPEMGAEPTARGGELLRMGLTVEQVVHSYGDICQAIEELAAESGAPVVTEEFQTLNRTLDNAIAAAVMQYVGQHDVAREVARSEKEVERLGEFAHELRNLINTATLAFQVLRGGRVNIKGSTGRVLDRTLHSLRELVNRSLTEVRLNASAAHRSRFRAANFIEEVEIAAAMEAKSRGTQLVVAAVNFDWFVQADRHLLASAMANLLQNAFKFTEPGGHVFLRTRATQGRIVFEVEDECGGISPETIEGLFRPYVQERADRSGLGLGLTIARRAVEANGGHLTARDLPGKGCVFAIELPLASDAPMEALPHLQ